MVPVRHCVLRVSASPRRASPRLAGPRVAWAHRGAIDMRRAVRRMAHPGFARSRMGALIRALSRSAMLVRAYWRLRPCACSYEPEVELNTKVYATLTDDQRDTFVNACSHKLAKPYAEEERPYACVETDEASACMVCLDCVGQVCDGRAHAAPFDRTAPHGTKYSPPRH